MKRQLQSFLLTCSLVMMSAIASAAEPLPISDAHMHYNIETRSTWSPQRVIALWR
ncbi:hypothetical protein ACO0LC_06340 [Undibacterium sp. JH2W]|uniref:hypothetical protein n=1 Tax=Undibacterium sp. JH2W TaxID=3413037 RepID=UPI003BF45D24